MAGQCKAKNARGEPCAAPALAEGEYCYWHSPELAAERAIARKKGGRNRRQVKSSDAEQQAVSLTSPQDALALIERAANDCLILENSLSRSRALGYLAGVALKALEIGELEERLAVLEQRLEGRCHGQQQAAG